MQDIISKKIRIPLWKTLGNYIIKLNIELPYDPSIPLLGIYPYRTFLEKKNAPICSLQHCYNSQDMEATQTSLNRHVDVVHRDNGILLSHQKNEVTPLAAT